MFNDPALYMVLIISSILAIYLLLNRLSEKLLMMIMLRYDYVWYEIKRYNARGKLIYRRKVITHQILLKEIDYLSDLLEEKVKELEHLKTIKKEQQQAFVPASKNGFKITLPYNEYLITFSSPWNQTKWENRDKYVWVERKNYTTDKHGNHRESPPWYGWVRYPESDDDTGDAVYNRKTDTPLLDKFPPVWPNGKERGELIPNEYLPFSWDYAPQFSVKQYTLFEDK